MRAERMRSKIGLACEAVGINGTARLKKRRRLVSNGEISYLGIGGSSFFSEARLLTHLAFRALSSLHTVATLDYIGLQAYRTRSPV